MCKCNGKGACLVNRNNLLGVRSELLLLYNTEYDIDVKDIYKEAISGVDDLLLSSKENCIRLDTVESLKRFIANEYTKRNN